jgi:hypothetical protein
MKLSLSVSLLKQLTALALNIHKVTFTISKRLLLLLLEKNLLLPHFYVFFAFINSL